MLQPLPGALTEQQRLPIQKEEQEHVDGKNLHTAFLAALFRNLHLGIEYLCRNDGPA
jgi:hypothetical protein